MHKEVLEGTVHCAMYFKNHQNEFEKTNKQQKQKYGLKSTMNASLSHWVAAVKLRCEGFFE